MNFIEAVKLTKEGKCIKRPGWSKCQYLNSKAFDENSWCTYQTNYEDVLANDWEIFGEKHVTFQEAFKALNNGKRIKRNFITFFKHFSRDSSGVYTVISKLYDGETDNYLHDKSIFSFDDIRATDWIIY